MVPGGFERGLAEADAEGIAGSAMGAERVKDGAEVSAAMGGGAGEGEDGALVTAGGGGAAALRAGPADVR